MKRYGKYDTYDGSGYVFDFDKRVTKQVFTQYIENMFEHGYLDEATRALFV